MVSRWLLSRLRVRVWPWVPALLLVSLLGTQLLVLSSVLDDPTFSTEPDYYRKALDWDAQQARARESRALGWTARASTAAAGATASVTVAITSAQDQAVDGATLRAVAFPNARAGQPRELTFREVAPGVYHAELGSARPGLWELRCSAVRGRQHFESTLRVEIQAGGVGS
jgi:nitrogen fixation protein FixH